MDYSLLASLAGGYLEARTIQVAVSMGVFDALNEKNISAPSLASSLGTDHRATELFLDALVSLGLLEKRDRLFSLTEVSSVYLVHSSPKYFGDMILFDSMMWDCWGNLEKAIRSGKPVHSPNMYQEDPRETARFIHAMHSLVRARGDAQILTETIDLSGVRELLDIGPGPGTYAIHLCGKYPRLRATLFDLPGTMKITERFVKDSGFEDRIRLVTGDYRVDPIRGKYQMIFLSNIIHAEGAEENSLLMTKLNPCIDQGGTIVIKDHILDESLAGPPAGALFALFMLLTTEHGRCYSFSDVTGWLESAGFKRVRKIPLPSPLTSSLVIGQKD
ncbi:MAG: methyltransferase [Candidatus Binatia bacterium]